MATHVKKHIKNNNSKKHEFVTAEKGETYATITGLKGDARFEIEVRRTGQKLVAKARGALIKGPSKQRLQIGDIILIQEGDPSYILTKYSDEDVKKLTKLGQLISFKAKGDDDNNILFEDDIEDQEAETIKIDDDFISGI
jgi:hypothetical protein